MRGYKGLSSFFEIDHLEVLQLGGCHICITCMGGSGEVLGWGDNRGAHF